MFAAMWEGIRFGALHPRETDGQKQVMRGAHASGEQQGCGHAGCKGRVTEVAEYLPLQLDAGTQSFLRLTFADGRELFLLRRRGMTPELQRRATWAERFCGAQSMWSVQLWSRQVAVPLCELQQQVAADSQGTLSSTWAQEVRVRKVEEHCRHAQLGLWGWIFRLKHSVLAVQLSGTKDLLYLDKNADIGVSWRRAGWRESFPEAPRSGYSFDVDLSLQELWEATASTKSFQEAQEVSNCQHFVRESLEELSRRGHLQGATGPTLRNQQVADWLYHLGYLDDERKALASPSATDLRRLWGSAMSWGSKLGLARWTSGWAECVHLRPVDQEERRRCQSRAHV